MCWIFYSTPLQRLRWTSLIQDLGSTSRLHLKVFCLIYVPVTTSISGIHQIEQSHLNTSFFNSSESYLFVGARQYVSTASQIGQSLLSISQYLSTTLQRRQFYSGNLISLHVSTSCYISTISKMGQSFRQQYSKMRLSGQLQTSFFFAKIFRAYKNENQTNHSVKSFYVAFLKIVAFFIFCSLNFIFLVGFGLICVFVRTKSFRKKKLVCGCPDYLILLYY